VQRCPEKKARIAASPWFPSHLLFSSVTLLNLVRPMLHCYTRWRVKLRSCSNGSFGLCLSLVQIHRCYPITYILLGACVWISAPVYTPPQPWRLQMMSWKVSTSRVIGSDLISQWSRKEIGIVAGLLRTWWPLASQVKCVKASFSACSRASPSSASAPPVRHIAGSGDLLSPSHTDATQEQASRSGDCPGPW
jgi:hypothetical protein